ncbi:MAG: hypothetical protein QXJ14_01180 [Candidatus Aenigmatarchaeota archaeon]
MIKSQVSIEFLVTTTVFISFVGYLLFNLYNYKTITMDNLNIELVNLELYKISEILINDIGYPSFWNPNNVIRIGLAANISSKNFLNSTKLNYLKNINPSTNNCSNITYYLDSDIVISLNISKIYPVQEIIFNCTSRETLIGNVSLERFAFSSDNSIVNIKIYGRPKRRV